MAALVAMAVIYCLIGQIAFKLAKHLTSEEAAHIWIWHVHHKACHRNASKNMTLPVIYRWVMCIAPIMMAMSEI